VWKIGNLQKPRWQMLSTSSSCKGHNRIVFSMSAGGEHFTTLVSVSMDRQVQSKTGCSISMLLILEKLTVQLTIKRHSVQLSSLV